MQRRSMRSRDLRGRPPSLPRAAVKSTGGATGDTAGRARAAVCAVALALGGLTVAGCASDAAATSAIGEVAPPITARALADSLGLRPPRPTVDGPVYLESGFEDRIALFPGSSIATVRGVRHTLSERLAPQGSDDLMISAADAAILRGMWQQGIRVGTSRSAVGAFRGSAAGGAAASGTGRRLSIEDLPPAPGRRRPASASASSAVARVSARERLAWGVPLRRPWQYIVIHHSATPAGNAAAFNKAHLARGWDGLGYHFVIGNGNKSPDGRIEVGFRWTKQREGAHAGNDLMNQRGIGICLVGDFSKTSPTAAQMAALRRLCDFLSAYCEIPPQNLRLHRDFRQTECPGRYFPHSFALRPIAAVRGGTVARRRSAAR